MNLDGGETKKVPGTRYQVPYFGDGNAKKGGPSHGELSWYVWWKRGNRNTTNYKSTILKVHLMETLQTIHPQS